MGAPDYDLQLRQRRGFTNVVGKPSLHQVQRGRPAVVVRHHYHGRAQAPDFIEESKLLLHRKYARIEIQQEHVALLSRDNFPDSVYSPFENDGEFAAKSRRQQELETDVLRIQKESNHSGVHSTVWSAL